VRGEAEGAERPELRPSPTRNERQGVIRDPAPGVASFSPRVSRTLVGCRRSQEVAALLEPIAPAADLNDMDVVQQAI